ncbi:MAG: ATP-dependent 6-phosphofructokinase [Acidobacteria bacterium]|nr:MAG: ATP-dependent 6-phosphofructokinase [Acidobacteriota bacterium]
MSDERTPDAGRPDFTVESLGPCRHPSPMGLGESPGDGLVDFVDDGRRLLFDLDLHAVRAELAAGAEPAALELAGPRSRLFFRPNDVRAAIVTTGGLCPGINDVVRSIVLTLNWHYGVREILGIRYGLRGFVAPDPPPMPLRPETVRTVHHEGGSFLGSSRGGPSAAEIVDFLDREAISALFMIGGDGTMRAALAVREEIARRNLAVAVVGVPKTIDNDIPFVDATFGMITAVSLARQAVDAAHAEAQGALNGVGLVRLMGRESGFIAAQAALASGEANFVLIPEVPFDLDGPHGFLACLHRRIVSRRHAVVVVAEGAGQQYIPEGERRGTDASGNPVLGDIGRFLKGRILAHFREHDVPVTVKYIDPSYMIRSAPPTASDAIYCQQLGQNAVHAAMAGKTGLMVGRVHGQQVHVPIRAVAGRRRRLDPEHPLWRSVLQSTGQPVRMVNEDPAGPTVTPRP